MTRFFTRSLIDLNLGPVPLCMFILKQIALLLLITYPIASGETEMVKIQCVGGVLNGRMLNHPEAYQNQVPQYLPPGPFAEKHAGHTLNPAYVEDDPSLPATGRDWKVPRWIIVGILSRETRSRLALGDAGVDYNDRRRGAAGERGPTQITPDAFKDAAKSGERFAHLERDMVFTLTMTERILVAHKKALGTWERAIRAYHRGRGNWDCTAARQYYEDVKALGNAK